MSNPSGDSTISGLPLAQTLLGTEQFVVDQNQTGTLATVRLPLSQLAKQLFNGGNPLPVSGGGTGNTTLAAHAVLLGEGASAVVQVAPGASGTLFASTGTTTDPSYQTFGALGIAAKGANSDITSLSGLTTALSVAQGGSGRQTLTAHGVLVGEGTTAINQIAPSTAGQALISAGASADPVFGNPTGSLIAVTTFTSSGTWTPNAATKSWRARGCGGSGGSGGCAATGASTSSVGGGGASGSPFEHYTTSVPSAQTITIGAAGTAGAAGANNGGQGGTTSIGALITAPGGNGGIGGAASSVATPVLGGAPGGVATGASIFNGNGQPGGVGFAGLGGGNVSGAGAPSIFGGGANPVTATAGGVASTSAGAGASGASAGTSQAAQAGAVGSKGIVIIEEFA